MKPVVFSALSDLMFDQSGVTQISSGTSPNNSNDTRIVLRNSATTRHTKEQDDAVKAAATAGVVELERHIRTHYAQSGRGDEGFWQE